jgi:hypothetical protein
MPKIVFPRGATLAFTGLYRNKQSRVPITIQGATVTAAFRDSRRCDSATTEATAENLDDGSEELRGQYRVVVAAELTAAWPIGETVGDVRIEYPSGDVVKSPLINLAVTESPTT